MLVKQRHIGNPSFSYISLVIAMYLFVCICLYVFIYCDVFHTVILQMTVMDSYHSTISHCPDIHIIVTVIPQYCRL